MGTTKSRVRPTSRKGAGSGPAHGKKPPTTAADRAAGAVRAAKGTAAARPAKTGGNLRQFIRTQEGLEEFVRFYKEEALVYAQENRLDRIEITSQEIYKVDIFIKMLLHQLLFLPWLLRHFNNSALSAFRALWQSWLKDNPKSDRAKFVAVVVTRLNEDIQLKQLYVAKGPHKDRAAAELRKRGLL